MTLQDENQEEDGVAAGATFVRVTMGDVDGEDVMAFTGLLTDSADDARTRVFRTGVAADGDDGDDACFGFRPTRAFLDEESTVSFFRF